MCKNPVEDIRQAKARLVVILGDLEIYMEFMTQQQKKRMKQGVKYADFCIFCNKKSEAPVS